MRRKYNKDHEPDWTDLITQQEAMWEDHGLVVRCELRVTQAGRQVIIRCYRADAVFRSAVVVQSITTVALRSTRSIAATIYGAVLDCYVQADNLRPREPATDPEWVAPLPRA